MTWPRGLSLSPQVVDAREQEIQQRKMAAAWSACQRGEVFLPSLQKPSPPLSSRECPRRRRRKALTLLQKARDACGFRSTSDDSLCVQRRLCGENFCAVERRRFQCEFQTSLRRALRNEALRRRLFSFGEKSNKEMNGRSEDASTSLTSSALEQVFCKTFGGEKVCLLTASSTSGSRRSPSFRVEMTLLAQFSPSREEELPREEFSEAAVEMLSLALRRRFTFYPEALDGFCESARGGEGDKVKEAFFSAASFLLKVLDQQLRLLGPSGVASLVHAVRWKAGVDEKRNKKTDLRLRETRAKAKTVLAQLAIFLAEEAAVFECLDDADDLSQYDDEARPSPTQREIMQRRRQLGVLIHHALEDKDEGDKEDGEDGEDIAASAFAQKVREAAEGATASSLFCWKSDKTNNFNNNSLALLEASSAFARRTPPARAARKGADSLVEVCVEASLRPSQASCRRALAELECARRELLALEENFEGRPKRRGRGSSALCGSSEEASTAADSVCEEETGVSSTRISSQSCREDPTETTCECGQEAKLRGRVAAGGEALQALQNRLERSVRSEERKMLEVVVALRTKEGKRDAFLCAKERKCCSVKSLIEEQERLLTDSPDSCYFWGDYFVQLGKLAFERDRLVCSSVEAAFTTRQGNTQEESACTTAVAIEEKEAPVDGKQRRDVEEREEAAVISPQKKNAASEHALSFSKSSWLSKRSREDPLLLSPLAPRKRRSAVAPL